MNKVIAGVVVAVIVCFAVNVLAAGEDRPALVTLTTVKQETVAATTRITGNLYFETLSYVSAELAGKAQHVYFNQGDAVNKGDRLVRIDTRLLENELSLRQSQLAKIDIRLQEAEKDVNRYEELYKNDVASEVSYDDLRFGYKELIEEKAALKKKIETTRIKLEKSVVYAPFKGIVLEKTVEKGSWVQPGASVCKMGGLASVSIKVPVSEKLLRFTNKGDNVSLTLTAFEKKLQGTVIGFMPYADPKTGTINLKLSIDYNGPVYENMSAVVDVPSSQKQESLVVPRDGLVTFQGNKQVYIIQDDKAVQVPVTVSGFSGQSAFIDADDLKPGMKIVVEGNERLRPGQAVKIVGEK